MRSYVLERRLHDRTPRTISRYRGEAAQTTMPAAWVAVFAGEPTECVDTMMHLSNARGKEYEHSIATTDALPKSVSERYEKEIAGLLAGRK